MIACMPHQALASGETGAPQYADYADHADDPEQLAADEMSRLSAGNPVTITPGKKDRDLDPDICRRAVECR